MFTHEPWWDIADKGYVYPCCYEYASTYQICYVCEHLLNSNLDMPCVYVMILRCLYDWMISGLCLGVLWAEHDLLWWLTREAWGGATSGKLRYWLP